MENVVEDFSIPSAVSGSISFTDLIPGTYTLAQTFKWHYNVTSTTVNGIEAPATTEGNRTLLTITILPGEETSVVFNNAYIPEATFAKPAPPGEDSSPPDYGLPSLCAVPVQSTWDPHIDEDDSIDLVMGKPMKIMVNLVPLLTTQGGIVNPNDQTKNVALSVTAFPDGFLSQPFDATRSGVDINAEGVVIIDTDPPSTLGDYTITCTITVAGTQPHTEDTLVSVKETPDLSLYYTHLSMADYGTVDINAFNDMVTHSSEFIEAVYPVPHVSVLDSGMTSMEGNPVEPNWYGLYKDCQKVAAEARLKFPQGTPNVIGVAIAPFTNNKNNYFAYHGAASKGKSAVGVSFGPTTKGVVAAEGYYSSVAHEIGHTFNLYYGVPEQYTEFNPGAPASGFWPEKREWRSSYDFMGLVPFQSTSTVWVTGDTTFEPIFSKLKTPNDPQIIFVSGIIYEDESGQYAELPLTWFSMPYGTPDTVPEGQYALRFNLADGTSVVTSFEASTTMHICPGIEAGEDLQADYPGLGEIPLDFAGFAFATTYPESTVNIDLLDTSKPEGQQVITTIDAEDVVPSVSAYFGGFRPPINSDGSSVFKLKSTVPVKFQLQEAEGAFINDAVVTLSYAKISNGIVGTQVEAITNVQATTGNLFRNADDQYIYNWKTKGLTTGTYELTATFEDGKSKSVVVSLR